MALFWGSNSWSFPDSVGDPEEVSVDSPSSSSIVTAGSGSMMKWWVAAPSEPEKLDDGEPRRSEKTTTITHLRISVRSFVRGSSTPCCGCSCGYEPMARTRASSRAGHCPLGFRYGDLQSAVGCSVSADRHARLM
ncbi:hypothetical protein EVAR_87291_1 [Eumeta japonica]|uniref:Uncharacterized protein n=1 Tax=Eumeta variegata TaxID=151549 RepID=A0A4C1VX28_EUMVA|nr:hypothetical protein EVAR_87291_1 [Eumeta japonica]